jgi:transcriptional regulator with XRE-family HTH domain
MSEPRGALGAFIREQRKLAHLSLRELARMSRISNAYLSQVERGLHEPSLRVLNAVASVLEVPVEAMVSAHDDAFSGDTAGDHPSLELAIRLDPRLNPTQKQALLGVYRGFVLDSDSSASETIADEPPMPWATSKSSTRNEPGQTA